MNDTERKKWDEVLQMEYMSSEESDGNDNELKVHQIPWLLENVKKFKQLLDSEKLKHMSAQSKRQTKKKVMAEGTSQRPQPSSGKAWLYKTS